jgi:gliding motility-associated-like protein
VIISVFFVNFRFVILRADISIITINMKRFLSFIVANLIMLSAWCQTSLFYNNGASVYMMPGSYMIVSNDSLHNYQGIIQNAGDLRVDGDIYNDAGATLTGGPATPTGLYDIGGSWVNSGIFTAYEDSVMINGPSNPGVPQLITGNAISAFYDLILAGVPGSAKLQTINATVSNILDLRSDELATQQYQMLVTNPSPAAITQTNVSTGGWVSSLGAGSLERATNSTSAYIFPTGTPSALTSGTVPYYYRPVDFSPTSAASNIYGARLVDFPDSDSYITSDFDDTLCKVNPHYYHRLYHTSGPSPANLTLYFDPAADGYWTDMAHWGSSHSNEWNYMGTSNEGSGYGFTSVEIPNWSRFTPDPFALAAKKFTVNAGPNQDVTIHQTVALNAVITTSPSNITGIVWAPDTFLSDNTIADPTFTAVQSTEYIIVVTDQAGCIARDTLTMTVLPDVLLIPTAFSPDQDVNYSFRPLNPNLKTLVFRVFDRWGQMVYETDVIGDGWDGNYKGRKQDIGVYVWQAQYSLTGINETFTSSGNVTLVR